MSCTTKDRNISIFYFIKLHFLWIGLIVLILSGCIASYPQQQSKVPTSPSIQKSPENSTPDPLSHGMVTGRVKKNITTQMDLLEMFGGPNVMTTDKEGTEVWMYDKTTTVTSGSYDSSEVSEENNQFFLMASFFGLEIPFGVAGVGGNSKGQKTSTNQGQHTYTRSVKTITFIVRFNSDKTVKNYDVRQASY